MIPGPPGRPDGRLFSFRSHPKGAVDGHNMKAATRSRETLCPGSSRPHKIPGALPAHPGPETVHQ